MDIIDTLYNITIINRIIRTIHCNKRSESLDTKEAHSLLVYTNETCHHKY